MLLWVIPLAGFSSRHTECMNGRHQLVVSLQPDGSDGRFASKQYNSGRVGNGTSALGIQGTFLTPAFIVGGGANPR
jgi:hypothetical protein